jgi:hypothetical protein
MKILKKALPILLTSSILLGTSAMAGYKQFPDVTSEHAYYDQISTIANLGVISGYDDGNFHPQDALTRASFSTMITLAFSLDYKTGTDENIFSDTITHWGKKYINAAYRKNIISGDGTGKFMPDQNITFEQAARILVSALGYDSDSALYTKEGDWSYQYIEQAKKLNLFDGIPNLKDYKAVMNRGEASVMIYNSLLVPTK